MRSLGNARTAHFRCVSNGLQNGIYVNLINDVNFKLGAGLTDEAIDNQINSTKVSKLLEGYRGDAPCDIEAVKDISFQIEF